ncbi:hypothetical protein BJX61DRAFT_506014 [Aspergillus egyptiacus]|nr:hypothetical protein BJX61DRAFT_506014 [Aspergillus egyptiacus]
MPLLAVSSSRSSFPAVDTSASVTTSLHRSLQRESNPNLPSKQHPTGQTQPGFHNTASKVGLALGLTVGAVLLILILAFGTMRLKYGTGFTLRSFFSRRFMKRIRKEKPTERCLSTSDETSAGSNPSPADKELELLRQFASRNVLPVQHRHHQQRQSIADAHTSAPCSRSSIAGLPAIKTHHSQFQIQPYETDEPEVADPEPRRYKSPSPLLPPTPSLWLPSQRPLPLAQEVSQPSPSSSHFSLGTRSSGPSSCGVERYEEEDGPGPDTLLDDQVLILPSPPSVIQSYGFRGSCL